MTKRELDALRRQLAKLEDRIGKKRDELRALIADFDSIIDSVRDADEEMKGVVQHLEYARDGLDRYVVDKLSEYV